jgi:threonine dehydratase
VLGLVAGVSAFRKQVAAASDVEGQALVSVAQGDIAPVRDRYGEGAGAAGLAGLCALTPQLAGKRVGLVLTGSNIDRATLMGVLADA